MKPLICQILPEKRLLFQGYVYYSTLFPLLKDFLKKSSTWNKNLFLYRFASELFHVKQKAGRF